jgi:hypothetical protein
MPRGRQEELRVWLPPELHDRVLRESAVRGVLLSRCIRDRLEAHFGLEEELLDIVERKDVPSVDQATGAALRLRLRCRTGRELLQRWASVDAQAHPWAWHPACPQAAVLADPPSASRIRAESGAPFDTSTKTRGSSGSG